MKRVSNMSSEAQFNLHPHRETCISFLRVAVNWVWSNNTTRLRLWTVNVSWLHANQLLSVHVTWQDFSEQTLNWLTKPAACSSEYGLLLRNVLGSTPGYNDIISTTLSSCTAWIAVTVIFWQRPCGHNWAAVHWSQRKPQTTPSIVHTVKLWGELCHRSRGRWRPVILMKDNDNLALINRLTNDVCGAAVTANTRLTVQVYNCGTTVITVFTFSHVRSEQYLWASGGLWH